MVFLIPIPPKPPWHTMTYSKYPSVPLSFCSQLVHSQNSLLESPTDNSATNTIENVISKIMVIMTYPMMIIMILMLIVFLNKTSSLCCRTQDISHPYPIPPVPSLQCSLIESTMDNTSFDTTNMNTPKNANNNNPSKSMIMIMMLTNCFP